MDATESWRGIRIHTIGHSTRSLEELVAILHAFEISTVVDIRTIPRSRRNPQFGQDVLPSALRERGIGYVHLPELGGLRKSRRDSPNMAWRNASFRGYADYMLTADFERGLDKLRAVASGTRAVMMCAEAVAWRCHRSLVADAVTARGAEVEHVTSATRSSPHRVTSFALVEGSRVTYPSDDGDTLAGETLGAAPLAATPRSDVRLADPPRSATPRADAPLADSPLADVRLATRAPFHLEATVRVLQRRPKNLVDVWDPTERYLRALATEDGVALVEVTNLGTIDEPDIRYTVLRGDPSDAARDRLGRSLRRILGLDVDPEPLQRVAEVERRVTSTAVALRGMRPPRFAGLFEAFANVIPFQQLSLDAGVATVGRLVGRFGEAVEHDGQRFHTFPEAQVVAEAPVDEIRACGLSMRKAEALHRIAAAIESGDLAEDKLVAMNNAEAARALTRIRGIGPWSANLVLLRGLGRLDVFPPGDVGAVRGLENLTGVAAGPSLDRIVERFGDLRGYLYFCALGGALLHRGLIRGAPPSGTRLEASDRSGA